MVYHRVAVVILYGVFQLLIPQHSSQAIPINILPQWRSDSPKTYYFEFFLLTCYLLLAEKKLPYSIENVIYHFQHLTI